MSLCFCWSLSTSRCHMGVFNRTQTQIQKAIKDRTEQNAGLFKHKVASCKEAKLKNSRQYHSNENQNQNGHQRVTQWTRATIRYRAQRQTEIHLVTRQWHTAGNGKRTQAGTGVEDKIITRETEGKHKGPRQEMKTDTKYNQKPKTGTKNQGSWQMDY